MEGVYRASSGQFGSTRRRRHRRVAAAGGLGVVLGGLLGTRTGRGHVRTAMRRTGMRRGRDVLTKALNLGRKGQGVVTRRGRQALSQGRRAVNYLKLLVRR